MTSGLGADQAVPSTFVVTRGAGPSRLSLPEGATPPAFAWARIPILDLDLVEGDPAGDPRLSGIKTRRLAFHRATIGTDPRRLEAALAGCPLASHGFHEVRVWFGKDAPWIGGRVTVGHREAPFTLRVAVEPRVEARRRVRLFLGDVRLYAPLPLPAPLVGAALARAIVAGCGGDRPEVRAMGAAVTLAPLDLALIPALVAWGWRLPDLGPAWLESVERHAGELRLAFGSERRPTERVSPLERTTVEAPVSFLEGERMSEALAGAEAKLFSGDVLGAEAAFLQAVRERTDERAARCRLGALRLAMGAPDAAADARELTARWPAFLPGWLFAAVGSSERGDWHMAAPLFERAARIADARGEHEDALLAEEAAAAARARTHSGAARGRPSGSALAVGAGGTAPEVVDEGLDDAEVPESGAVHEIAVALIEGKRDAADRLIASLLGPKADVAARAALFADIAEAQLGLPDGGDEAALATLEEVSLTSSTDDALELRARIAERAGHRTAARAALGEIVTRAVAAGDMDRAHAMADRQARLGQPTSPATPEAAATEATATEDGTASDLTEPAAAEDDEPIPEIDEVASLDLVALAQAVQSEEAVIDARSVAATLEPNAAPTTRAAAPDVTADLDLSRLEQNAAEVTASDVVDEAPAPTVTAAPSPAGPAEAGSSAAGLDAGEAAADLLPSIDVAMGDVGGEQAGQDADGLEVSIDVDEEALAEQVQVVEADDVAARTAAIYAAEADPEARAGALAELLRSLASLPIGRRATGYTDFGRTAEANGDPEVAEEAYWQGMQVEGLPARSKADFVLAHARLLLARGHEEAALDDLRAALDMAPDHEEALAALADLEFQRHDWDEARAHYAELDRRAGAGSLVPRPTLLHRRAILAAAAGDAAGAEALYQELASLDPRHAEAQRALGDFAFERGDLPGAARHLEEVLRLLPPDAVDGLLEARQRLAEVHVARQDWSAARDELELILAQEPGRVAALEPLVTTYENLELFEEAAAACERLARFQAAPARRAQALFHQGEILYESLGDEARAFDAFLRSSDLDPTYAPTALRLVTGFWRRGQLADVADVGADLARAGALGAQSAMTRLRCALAAALTGRDTGPARAPGDLGDIVEAPDSIASVLAEAAARLAGRPPSDLEPAVAVVAAAAPPDLSAASLVAVERSLETLVGDDPAATGAARALGWMCERRGELSRARTFYGLAAFVEDDAPTVRHLAELGAEAPASPRAFALAGPFDHPGASGGAGALASLRRALGMLAHGLAGFGDFEAGAEASTAGVLAAADQAALDPARREALAAIARAMGAPELVFQVT
ncbi:MAG TPA: tetratricopeptide repeat protein, partial [Polyangia bacterium]